MKKLCKVLALLLAMMLLPLSAMAEDAKVDTVQALQEILLQHREAGLTEFKITCTKTLYDEIKVDNNAPLDKLCFQVGMTDYKLRTNRNGVLTFSDITYGTAFVAECATLDEAQTIIGGFLQQDAREITLQCSEDVFRKLFREVGMYHLMAELGVFDFKLQGNTLNVIFLSNITPSAVPYANVTSVNEAGEKIAAWREEKVPAFNLVFDAETYDTLDREAYRMMTFLGGVNDYKLSYSNSARTLFFTEVSYTDTPNIYCQSEEEVVAAIRAMGAKGASAFQLMLDEATYQKVYEDYFARLHQLEGQAGMTSSDLRYSSVTRTLLYDNAVISADVTILSSLAEAVAYVEACAARGDKDIAMLLAADVYADLMDGVDAFFVSDAKFYDLIANAGIAGADDIGFNRHSGAINLRGVQYFAGTNILRAVESGDESVLTAREQEALTAARKMAEDCRRDDQTATALAIHDALAALITYTDDEATTEDDCCIGALLDGKANCDGYADAMLLVGRLAGLNVRYQHGDSLNGGMGSYFSTHMWNLIELDGAWRMIDVTWDDSGDGAYHLWFNIGEDRAALSHVWSREMTLPMLAVTDTANRPVAEYFTANEAEITAAATAAQSAGHTVFEIYVAQDSGIGMIAAREAAVKGLYGSIWYSWIDSLGCLHVQLAQ